MKKQNTEIVLGKIIEKQIFLLRSQKVMLDADLADLYGVPTGNLNRAVERNIKRFPEGFMFLLSKEETENLKCHFGISSWGGRRSLPRAFTERGVAMLSSVLKSDQAIQVNIIIMNTFVRLREIVGSHSELLRKIEAIEKKTDLHGVQIQEIFKTIKELLAPVVTPRRPIGIRVKSDD